MPYKMTHKHLCTAIYTKSSAVSSD